MMGPEKVERSSVILGLVVGAAALSGVVALSIAWGDRARFAAVFHDAEPAWFAFGVVLQALTSLMPAGGWWAVLQRAGRPVRLRHLYALALVQSFTNQALPAGGLAGIVMVVAGMDRQGVRRPVGLAAMLVDQLGWLTSYAAAILAAVGWYAIRGKLQPVLVIGGVVLVTTLLVQGVGLVWLTSPGRVLPGWLPRSAKVNELAHALLDTDPRLVRDPRLLAWCFLLRAGNVALDSATSWACLRAVGVELSAPDAAAAFVVAWAGRSMGLVPGGLGTYEASSIAALVLLGVQLEPALAATLLFRVLTFWLPMLPGLLLGGVLGRPR